MLRNREIFSKKFEIENWIQFRLHVPYLGLSQAIK